MDSMPKYGYLFTSKKSPEDATKKYISFLNKSLLKKLKIFNNLLLIKIKK